jgi:ribosome biogenesis protein MAK21
LTEKSSVSAERTSFEEKMGKSKKEGSQSSSSFAADIGLAPEALASLTNKLKHDLNQTRTEPTNKSKKSKNDKTPKQRANKKENKQKLPGAKEPKEKESQIVSSVSKKTKGTAKAQEPSSKSQQTPFKNNKKDGKTSNGNVPGRSKDDTQPSLLDDILALGGSKEDLDLVKGVDSDEENFTGPIQSNAKGPSDHDVPSFFVELSHCLDSKGVKGSTENSWP